MSPTGELMHRMASYQTIAIATVAAMAGAVISTPRSALSAGSQGTSTPASATIGNVYTWMNGQNFVAAMTVTPFADTSAQFSSRVQYVFHTTSGPGFPESKISRDIICTFDTNQIISCWLGTDEYVTGDASKEAGIASDDGKFKVFAGLRADPFFFNLSGYNDTVAAVVNAMIALGDQNAGCPNLQLSNAIPLQTLLKEVKSNANPNRTNPDDFVSAFTLAIVVSVDKSLVTQGGNLVSVWGATYQAQ